MKSLQPFAAAIVMIAMLAGGQSNCSACSVPVFRYALELWAPDSFELYVFHRGELSESEQDLVARLNSATLANEINLRVTLLDLDDSLEPEPLAIWESVESKDLDQPLLVLQTPARRGPVATVLTLELTPEHVDQLLDSPARQEIARRILGGDSVVWVLLESGQAEQDDHAFATLTNQIAILEASLELPELAAEDANILSNDSEPLELIFTALRVSRDDPAERTLVELLLSVEPDLRDPQFSEMPMVFPVFGRGRALYALVGAGITPSTIDGAARYLTGDCQCTVKAENPGADLLMAVDWDRLVTPTLEQDQELPPLGGLASFADLSDNKTSTDAPTADRDADQVAEANPGLARTGTAEQPASQESSTTTDSDTSAVASLGDPPSSPRSSEPRMGFIALFIVSLLGVMVLAASVVLTRRET